MITLFNKSDPARPRKASISILFGSFLLSLVGCEHTGSPTAKRHMVAAANPLAVGAGLDILRQGGSAVDAVIATQMVLTLVEPQSSGIGGGAFLLHYQPGNATDGLPPVIDAYDGRETAPKSANENLFLDAQGKKIPWRQRMAGGKGVGIPGLLRMLELSHKRHGKLPWARLFNRAIDMANKGFSVSPRLHAMIKRNRHLKNFPVTRRFFFTRDGEPLPVGTLLKNPHLADTLRQVAAKGANAFYTGTIARDIAAAVTNTHHLPAKMTVSDIASYQAKKRRILCHPYRQWRVCGMPPPTSGGIAVAQILSMLEPYDLSRIPPLSTQAVHLVAEASKLAFADRNQYLGDPDFVKIPVAGLLDKNYLKSRAAKISADKAMGQAMPGVPPQLVQRDYAPDDGDNRPISTSHISVIDAKGNAVSMTTTIGTAFGSRIMVRGFVLNDELTDFASVPRVNGHPKANRAEPGKRPRSSMSPTIVTDKDGKLVMAVGSPGGSSIIGYVLKALIAGLDWKMTMQDAIALPNFLNKNRKTELEKGTKLEALAPSLEKLGHQIRIRTKTSGLHGIRVRSGGYEGGADPRREGVAHGD
ncbi:MAG: gamma-glutamyltransferase [Alphaproteobacteria bacterium]|nr:gamma-glutamyltransferase [Alphaproteobacteria bacterium]